MKIKNPRAEDSWPDVHYEYKKAGTDDQVPNLFESAVSSSVFRKKCDRLIQKFVESPVAPAAGLFCVHTGNLAAKNETQAQKLRRNSTKIKRRQPIVPKNLGPFNPGISIAVLP